jgi:hypothetical protein
MESVVKQSMKRKKKESNLDIWKASLKNPRKDRKNERKAVHNLSKHSTIRSVPFPIQGEVSFQIPALLPQVLNS